MSGNSNSGPINNPGFSNYRRNNNPALSVNRPHNTGQDITTEISVGL